MCVYKGKLGGKGERGKRIYMYEKESEVEREGEGEGERRVTPSNISRLLLQHKHPSHFIP